MSELVSVEDRGRVRHLVMNRPEKRNAFNRELVLALHDAAQDAAAATDVHCVVLRGNGPVVQRRDRRLPARRPGGHQPAAALPHGDCIEHGEPVRGDAQARDRPDPRPVPRAWAPRWRWPATCA